MIEKNKEVDYSYVTFYRDKTGEVLRYKFGRCLSDCTSDFKVYLDENKNLIQLYKNNKRIFSGNLSNEDTWKRKVYFYLLKDIFPNEHIKIDWDWNNQNIHFLQKELSKERKERFEKNPRHYVLKYGLYSEEGKLLVEAPSIPGKEFKKIIGGSKWKDWKLAIKKDPKMPLRVILTHIRHNKTNYDLYLRQGMCIKLAREKVKDEIFNIALSWGIDEKKLEKALTPRIIKRESRNIQTIIKKAMRLTRTNERQNQRLRSRKA